MAGEAEWELEGGIVSDSRRVFPDVAKGYMTKPEETERGHISRALHRAGSCSPSGPEQLHHLMAMTEGSP